jgi:hypothetical protein
MNVRMEGGNEGQNGGTGRSEWREAMKVRMEGGNEGQNGGKEGQDGGKTG